MAQLRSAASIPISELTHNITLTITGLGVFTFWVKIARVLFLLGARIAGVNLIIEP